MSIKNSHIYNHSSFIKNNNYRFNRDEILEVLPKVEIDNAYNIISKWDNYKPTPLLNLNKLSKMAFEDPSTQTNPKKMTIDDMKILYEHSISGKLFE